MKRTSKVSKVKKKEMSRQLNPTNKALKERRFRQREKERKRFEGPMRKFLEYKYPNVFQEYTELYNVMERNHPDVRNLTKTRTFKNWVNTQNEVSPTDILSTVIRETLGQDYHEEDEAASVQIEQVEVKLNDEANGEASDQENDQANDEVNSEANDEANGEASDQIDGEFQDEVEDIIQHLMQDEAIRNILGTEPEDEGIEITPDDDIVFDIEPFDFDLEVEQYDW